MEPVEINAGSCYLRQFRADDRLDDRPALVEAFADPVMRAYVPHYSVNNLVQAAEYIALRAKGWADDRCSWAIAEPTTGGLIGEVGLKNLGAGTGPSEAAIWVHPDARRRGVAAAALGAAVRFGFGALELARVDYVCDEDNAASAALAARCGFTLSGPTTSLDGTPSQRWTLSP
jgi:RimJ/RimL family protein N-acetyltransferase